jgi:hypothetical protein
MIPNTIGVAKLASRLFKKDQLRQTCPKRSEGKYRAYGFESWPKLKAHVDGVTLQRLCNVVRQQDLAQARAMLKLRPELARLSLLSGTALHFAVFSRSPEMVRRLLQHGADSNQGIWPHRDATSSFIMAKERGYHEIAQIILDAETHRPSAQNCA